MKIAIVHEWLTDWAGSEKVLEQIVACFPDADLYSLIDYLSAKDRARIDGKRATTSFVQKLPFSRRCFGLYLPFMPLAIEQLDVTGYDLVISSSHAVAKGVITTPDQVHISYVHSPMRYAWDSQHDYLRSSVGGGLRGLMLRVVLHYLRQWDLRTVNGVDAFIANSDFIARRIRKIYAREAAVVHPPVELERFACTERKDDFYLCVGRLMPYKRIDLAVEAFRALPDRRLVVIGEGSELRRARRLAGPNVTFMGAQPDSIITDHFARTRALIFPGKEDFGITLVEAQASGTPVIAFGAGGALDSVVPHGRAQPTGIFFREQTSAALAAAVREFEAQSQAFTASNCRRNAERFSRDVFRERFRNVVQRTLDAHARG